MIPASNAQENTEKLVSQLKHGHFKQIYKKMDKEMGKLLTPKKLKKTWAQMEKYLGKYQRFEFIKTEIQEGYFQEKSTLFFEKGVAVLRLAINDEQKISGMLIAPGGYQTPDYGSNLALGKLKMAVKYDSISLPGELLIPRDCNQCPVVVLVHGSGANDMDETIMGNKVFYDLALGLAANGIATYRYHKRFNVYPELQKTAFSIQDETVNDAVAAVRQILADTSLPTGKIFVFGHSMGGYAAPMIGDSLPNIAGLILGAAPARKIEDVLEYQFQYFRETGSLTKWQYFLYKPMHKRSVNKIRKGKFNKGSKPMLVYMPGSFFKSVATYDPAESASKQEIPLLVLQGEKDFQVTMVDFNMFKEKLQIRKNTTFISYPTLNHLFMTSTMEKPTTVEYFVPSNVSYPVINDIQVWIKKVE